MRSKLTDIVVPSPHERGHRLCEIDRITIHCVIGQCTAEALGAWFQLPEVHSCNYGIDRDGRIVCCVEEDHTSICSSSYANDMRSVTIEVASDTVHPYAVRPAAMQTLIELCSDICVRHNRPKLLWLEDKYKTLSYQPADDEMVITLHRWFSQTICPGQFLIDHMKQISTLSTELSTEGSDTAMHRYNTLDECPDWSKATVQKLLRHSSIKGTNSGLQLSEDMLRLLVILDREGLFYDD